MKSPSLKRCPLGIQTFSEIRERDMLYVDKTAYIHAMADRFKYCFLNRPRRFGKSLLVTTLKSYFKGEKDLFKGLAIEQLEQDWTVYPVLHFDMSMGKHATPEQLETYLGALLGTYEKKYGIDTPHKAINLRLAEIIRCAHQLTGRKVVVLIDEYDAPLLDVMHDEEMLPQLRKVMHNFFSPLKGCDEWLHFVFLTGITKFSQLNIFSELNNLKNISMEPEFAGICGMTETEMMAQMGAYIDRLADALGLSREEAIEKLKAQYDGYHFTWPSPDIYNPFSLMNALTDLRLNNYWFDSGTPSYLIELMRKSETVPSQLGSMEALASAFDVPTEQTSSLVPLLYQSGYLTIKDYVGGAYLLDIPNKEVRIGLMECLLPHYVFQTSNDGLLAILKMSRCLAEDNPEGMLSLLRDYLLTIPQCDNTHYEGHYQQMLYVVFSLLGRYAEVEVRTAKGRVDLVVKTAKALYLFELKMHGSAQDALAQINEKQYASRFALQALPVVKIGIRFDLAQHTLAAWCIER